jgi:hypothetical protein
MMARQSSFATRILVLAAALGSVASCRRQPEAIDPSVAVRSAASFQGTEAAPENPFTFDECRLPHYSSPCGTHSPDYLSSDVARAVIDRVFAECGYQLQAEYPFNAGGITFIADGYDAAGHVGYVYADYDNLDLDGFMTFSDPVSDTMLQYLISDAEYRDHESARELGSILQLADHSDRERAFQLIVGRDRTNKLSLSEVRALIERSPVTDEFFAVVSHFDFRFAVPSRQDSLESETKEIAMVPDPAKRQRLGDDLEAKLHHDTEERLAQAVRDYIVWARSKGLDRR